MLLRAVNQGWIKLNIAVEKRHRMNKKIDMRMELKNLVALVYVWADWANFQMLVTDTSVEDLRVWIRNPSCVPLLYLFDSDLLRTFFIHGLLQVEKVGILQSNLKVYSVGLLWKFAVFYSFEARSVDTSSSNNRNCLTQKVASFNIIPHLLLDFSLICPHC